MGLAVPRHEGNKRRQKAAMQDVGRRQAPLEGTPPHGACMLLNWCTHLPDVQGGLRLHMGGMRCQSPPLGAFCRSLLPAASSALPPLPSLGPLSEASTPHRIAIASVIDSLGAPQELHRRAAYAEQRSAASGSKPLHQQKPLALGGTAPGARTMLGRYKDWVRRNAGLLSLLETGEAQNSVPPDRPRAWGARLAPAALPPPPLLQRRRLLRRRCRPLQPYLAAAGTVCGGGAEH